MIRIPRAFQQYAETATPRPAINIANLTVANVLMENAVCITFGTVRVDWLLRKEYIPTLLVVLLSKRELLVQRVVDAKLFFVGGALLAVMQAGSEWLKDHHSISAPFT